MAPLAVYLLKQVVTSEEWLKSNSIHVLSPKAWIQKWQMNDIIPGGVKSKLKGEAIHKRLQLSVIFKNRNFWLRCDIKFYSFLLLLINNTVNCLPLVFMSDLRGQTSINKCQYTNYWWMQVYRITHLTCCAHVIYGSINVFNLLNSGVCNFYLDLNSGLHYLS